MPRGVPLTPDQIAEATRVYLATGNYSEAARVIGSDVSNVRRQLIAAEEPTRAMLHTHALAKAERDARRALQRVRAKLEAFVEEAVDTKDLTALAAQIHDNARATTQMRVAHAKLTGDHAAEKHAHTIDLKKLSDADLDAEIARLSALAGGARAAGSAPAGEGAADGDEEGSSG